MARQAARFRRGSRQLMERTDAVRGDGSVRISAAALWQRKGCAGWRGRESSYRKSTIVSASRWMGWDVGTRCVASCCRSPVRHRAHSRLLAARRREIVKWRIVWRVCRLLLARTRASSVTPSPGVHQRPLRCFLYLVTVLKTQRCCAVITNVTGHLSMRACRVRVSASGGQHRLVACCTVACCTRGACVLPQRKSPQTLLCACCAAAHTAPRTRTARNTPHACVDGRQEQHLSPLRSAAVNEKLSVA